MAARTYAATGCRKPAFFNSHVSPAIFFSKDSPPCPNKETTNRHCSSACIFPSSIRITAHSQTSVSRWQPAKSFSPLQAGHFLFYLPDGILPYPEQYTGSVIEFFQKLLGATPESCNRLIERLELQPVLDKRIQSLSKGYRRRLLLAIGLLSQRSLLMLDEPFDGFDLRQSLTVMDLLRDMLSGRSLLLSIHQLSEAERICHRFLLLDTGRVIAQGTLEELRRQAGLERGGLEEVFLALV